MNNSLTFITSNPSKAQQLAYHLDIKIEHQNVDLPEIQSLNLKEIVKHKAQVAFEHVKKPVIVEDTSLTFLAMGKLPGPLIKWFLKELGNDGLCKLLNGYDNRSAIAEVSVGLYNGKEMHFFEGLKKGTIAQEPRGVEGFGWDPIFIPENHTKTWGEMDVEEQKESSIRRIALKKLEKHIKSLSL